MPTVTSEAQCIEACYNLVGSVKQPNPRLAQHTDGTRIL